MGYHADLVIHAPFNKTLQETIVSLELSKYIILREEAHQPLLADSIRSSDA